MMDDGGTGQWEINIPGNGMNNNGSAIVVNGSNDIFAGGGVYATTEPEDWGFDNTLLSKLQSS